MRDKTNLVRASIKNCSWEPTKCLVNARLLYCSLSNLDVIQSANEDTVRIMHIEADDKIARRRDSFIFQGQVKWPSKV